jgi:hypothetical protein
MLFPLTSDERGLANRGLDSRLVTDAGRPISVDNLRGLNADDQAIVDEAFLRGASVEEAMGILFARALPRTDVGKPAYLFVPGVSNAEPASDEVLWSNGGSKGRIPPQPLETARDRVLGKYAEMLVARTPGEARQSLTVAASRVNDIEALLPFVAARHNAYVAHAKSEFDALSGFVRASFKPILSGKCIDPYRNSEEKYRAMRGAYYRAGWPFIKRDILDLITPTTFFGTAIEGGVHRELKDFLALVEGDIRKNHKKLADNVFRNTAGFSIEGFKPRFQECSVHLSNHAFGLAIDVDPDWNPQVKTKNAVNAFKRATGEDMSLPFGPYSSLDQLRKIYQRIVQASEKLKVWLNKFMPMYEQLQDERAKLRSDINRKKKIAALDRELLNNLDLAALVTLITEYEKPRVQMWQAYGIVTIPQEIIESFVALGRKNGARWGGGYENTKDIMHLELLQLASGKSIAPSRGPIKGFLDLHHSDAHPNPINGPR